MAQFSSDGKSAIEKTVDVVKATSKTPASEVDWKYEIERCAQWIRRINATNICLQFPDNLLGDAFEVSLRLKKLLNHNSVFILGDTSYGSCCVDEVAAQHVKADAIIHFGHACLSSTKRLPVLHIFDKNPLDLDLFVNQFNELFPDTSSNIILLYDVSFEHCSHDLKEILCKKYTSLQVPQLVCRENDGTGSVICGRLFCVTREVAISDYTVVYVGRNGRTFQNLVLELNGASIFIFDPWKGTTLEKYDVSNNKFLMQRMYLIEKVKDARTLGIVIGTLGISRYLETVDRIKTLAKKRGKKCYIIAVGKPNVPKLANFPEVDAFILLACAENSFVNERFFKPLLTPYEFELAFNAKMQWTTNYFTNFQDLLNENITADPLSSEDLVSEISNVSLTGGYLQNVEIVNHDKVNGVEAENPGIVAEKGDTSVSLFGSTGSYYLSNRSWKGLEKNLGKTEVKLAEKGRSGIPLRYEGEPTS